MSPIIQHSVQLIKQLSKCNQLNQKQIHNTLIHLRINELSNVITTLKVLKKNNLLESHKTYHNVLTTIFEDTPYPFEWDIRYKCKQEFTIIEKKVLFYFRHH
jgi:hypothetical protein